MERGYFFSLVAGLLFLLAWLLPNHYLPWLVAYNEFAGFATLIVMGLALAGGRVRLSVAALVCLSLALVPVLQGVCGVILFSGDALMAAVYMAGFAIMMAAGFEVAKEPELRASVMALFAWTLIVGAAISVWIALRQWLMLPGSIWVVDIMPGGRPFANLAQPNNLATLLCMGLAAVLYVFERRMLGAIGASLLALLLIFGVALTQSRTPWLGGFCAVLWWVWKSRSIAVRLPTTGFVAWVGVYALAILSFHSLAESLYLPSVSLGERAQGMHRLDLWWQLWQAVMQGPLWGYGWNQVSVAQVGVALAYPVPIMVEHSHNILLDLLLWNGPILGGAIILFATIWLVRMGWRARTVESLFALLAVGFVLVHGMLEFPLEYAFFLFPVGLLLGMVEADQRAPAVLSVPRWVSTGVLVMAVGMLGWGWREYQILEEDHRLMRFEAMRVGSLKAEHKAPDVVLLTQLREFIRFARTEASERMSQDELAWMRQVVYRYPYPPSLFRYALALGLNQQSQAGYEQMMILRSLHGDERYEEGRRALGAMQGRYPQLAGLFERLPKADY